MTRLMIAFAILASSSVAIADTMSKEACVDAHSRGQDARDQGKITLARKLFLTCAQSGCPAAVQGDCARFADDLSNLQPTVNFVARDGNGNDLPNTTVYVDGTLVATAIDGKPVDIDPGNHTVKFSNGGKDEIVTVVIGSGEKGRVVQARFGSATPSGPLSGTGNSDRTTQRKETAKTTHPKGSLALVIGGGVLAVGGAAWALYGNSQVPSQCSLSTHECAAPPGDKVFDDASSAASKVNIGIITASVGVAALAGGLVWYFGGAKTEKPSTDQAIAPWVSGNGGGVAVLGRF